PQAAASGAPRTAAPAHRWPVRMQSPPPCTPYLPAAPVAFSSAGAPFHRSMRGAISSIPRFSVRLPYVSRRDAPPAMKKPLRRPTPERLLLVRDDGLEPPTSSL